MFNRFCLNFQCLNMLYVLSIFSLFSSLTNASISVSRPKDEHCIDQKFLDSSKVKLENIKTVEYNFVRKWLLSTETLQKLQAIDVSGVDIEYKKLSFFDVIGGGGLKQRFLLRKEDCRDMNRLFEISGSELAVPACVLDSNKRNIGNYSELNIESIEQIPLVPRVLEVARIKSDKDCIALYEVAPGSVVVAQWFPAVLYRVGSAFGILHSLGWKHGDAHTQNVLYDHASRRVSLVDLDTFNRSSDFRYDYDQLLPLDSTLSDFTLPYSTTITCDISETTCLQQNHQKLKDVLKLQEFPDYFRRIEKVFKTVLYFESGYIKTAKNDVKEKMRSWLKSKCSYALKRLSEKFSDRFKILASDAAKDIKDRTPLLTKCSEGNFDEISIKMTQELQYRLDRQMEIEQGVRPFSIWDYLPFHFWRFW